MTFKKGDQVRTDDGMIGQILFIDRDGVEAQVALEKTSIKLRTDTLEKVSGNPPVPAPKLAKARAPRKKSVKTT
jgi:preprotein translocase subunit YajC